MSSSLSDSNDEEDFRSPPTPPSFTRVGGPPIQGETSARTSLNYIHPQNAKYLMKAPVRPKEKVGGRCMGSVQHTSVLVRQKHGS